MAVIRKITLSSLFPPLLALFLILLFNALVQPGFLNVEIRDGRLVGGLITILNRSVPVMLLSIGMTLVIATGGTDLSVGSVLAVASAVAISLIRGGDVNPTANTAMPLVFVILITMMVGIACGLWNGFLVAKIGMPPVVATLILMVAGRGLTQNITQERSLTTGHLPFGEIANGFTLGAPNQIWIAAGVLLLFWYFTRRTAFGLFIESVGANKSAATHAGIRSTYILFIIYALSGLCASIAGILSASNVLVIEPMNTGQNMELDAILAVVLGGTSMSGGKFNLGGSCIGAIILMALTQTMFFYGVPVEFSLSIKAVVIVIVVIIQSSTTQKFIASHFKKLRKREVPTQ
ncbi:MAG: ABC transporter permease [Oscillospiraceae bacterium]|nr:ABC transporter permease [Oscillospiraceae bacterium]